MIPLQFLIQRRIASLSQSATAAEAAQLMCDASVGCIMVNDLDGLLVGIVTDRDLACSALRRPDSPSLRLTEIMTPRPLTVEPSADVELVVHLMEDSGIRRIPVAERVNTGLRCVGLITLDDLLASKMIDSDRAARIVRSQIRRRSKVLTRSAPPPPSGEKIAPSTSQEPALSQFFRGIQEATGLPDQTLIPITEAILSATFRRLSYTSAAHFIRRLPEDLQGFFAHLPTEPVPNLKAETWVGELAQKFGYTQETMAKILSRLFSSLEQVIGQEEFRVLRSELPEDLSRLLAQESGASHNRPSAA